MDRWRQLNIMMSPLTPLHLDEDLRKRGQLTQEQKIGVQPVIKDGIIEGGLTAGNQGE